MQPRSGDCVGQGYGLGSESNVRVWFRDYGYGL